MAWLECQHICREVLFPRALKQAQHSMSSLYIFVYDAIVDSRCKYECVALFLQKQNMWVVEGEQSGDVKVVSRLTRHISWTTILLHHKLARMCLLWSEKLTYLNTYNSKILYEDLRLQDVWVANDWMTFNFKNMIHNEHYTKTKEAVHYNLREEICAFASKGTTV